VQILDEFPEIGYYYRKEPEGYIRVILCGHNRIGYLFWDPDVVEVLGVFHGALDMKRFI
jgi:plasmid stabilization system protein ParE